MLAIPALLLLSAPLQDPQPAPADDERRATVQSMFESFAAAIEGRDSRTFFQRFDVDRMLGSLDDQGLGGGDAAAFKFGVRLGFAQSMEDGDFDFFHGEWALRSIEPGPAEGRLRAITRSRDEDGYNTYIRWWLAEHDGGWRIYDWEDLDIGLRVSLLLAVSLDDGMKGALEVARFVDELEAFSEALWEEDIDRAQASLEVLEGLDVPPRVEALYWLHTSLYHDYLGDLPEALAALDQAASLSPDMPILDYQRADVLLQLGEPGEALTAANRYRARLGVDAQSDLLIGTALRDLGRRDEALEAIARGLADDPASADLVTLLGTVAEPDRLDELRAGFRALPDAPEWFDSILTDVADAEAWGALHALCDELDALVPDDPNVEYWRAYHRTTVGEYAKACELLLDALPRVPEDEHEYYLQTFLDACTYDGRATWGLEQIPDRTRDGFAYLTSEWEGDSDFLLELCAWFEEIAPDDPLLHFTRGQALASSGERDEAEKVFERATALAAGDALATRVHEWRIDNLVHLGRIRSAYELEPREESWLWIVDSCYWGDLGAELARAVELRRADRPEDPELPAWTGYAAWLLGDAEGAVEQLGAADLALDRLAERGYAYVLEGARVRGLARTGRFDEARRRMLELEARWEPDPLLPAVVEILAGEDDEALEALRRILALGYRWDVLLEDPDIGERIRVEPFVSLRPKDD